ncbi:MAG: Tripeptide aminopeptidase [Clostridiales bacterium 38_11]|nr:MAG: Tripeptide aminopeptidase [Clostridiales bacterium 38_11]HBH13263.1 peptidase T [Clostridiales bacterium]
MNTLVNRFLKYVVIDTQSDETVKTNPSTQKQFDLAHLLVDELKSIGLSNVTLSKHCYVTAEIPSNVEQQTPVIGFVAHMDTTTDMTGKHVNPRIIMQYDGEDVVLDEETKTYIRTSDFPEIKNYIGQDLIVTDGKTILGADNKAGIAEIMTATEYLINHPEIKHGTIKIAFTPDEEVGRGTINFDLEKFAADFAYTIDGGEIGELEYETFNAAQVKIVIQGRNVHPGSAKNKMINAQRIGFELNNLLPTNEKPEYTEGYEGFFHLLSSSGDVEGFMMNYIIRDHSLDKFNAKKALLSEISSFLNTKYGIDTVQLTIKDQYYNMKDKILPEFHIVETVRTVMEELEIEPIIKPVRGGTDGSALSLKGLPTPNIFTGGHNFHSKYEYIPVQSMEKAVDVIIGIIKKYAE